MDNLTLSFVPLLQQSSQHASLHGVNWYLQTVKCRAAYPLLAEMCVSECFVDVY